MEDWREYWQKYQDYLASIEGKVPPSAYMFATADWHYDYHDPRCPHDAWVEHLIIHEHSFDDRDSIRGLDIQVRLLGAYHDGYIELSYKSVNDYQLSYAPGPVMGAHSDWMDDEIRLSEHGKVIHEIVFVNARWYIECEDIAYEWRPFDQETSDA